MCSEIVGSKVGYCGVDFLSLFSFCVIDLGLFGSREFISCRGIFFICEGLSFYV